MLNLDIRVPSLLLDFSLSIKAFAFFNASRSFSSAGSAQGWVTRHVMLTLNGGSGIADHHGKAGALFLHFLSGRWKQAEL
jgi:hypothetical protein